MNLFIPANKPFSFRGLARRGFSLIELLIVMAIMAILTVMGVMAVGSLGDGKKLVAGGNQIVNLINLARQTAQGKNTLTMFVVVPGQNDDGPVFSVFEYVRSTQQWSQIEKWITLQKPISMDLVDISELFNSGYAHAPQITRAGSPLNPGDGYRFAIFLPDGRPLTTSTAPLYLLLTGRQPANFYKILLNQNTGIPIVRRP